MDDYREALQHLNGALDAMVRQGDTLVIATIAQPIAMVERAILQRQAEILHSAGAQAMAVQAMSAQAMGHSATG